ncbi:uncharacterized protein [Primulina huaijiensis]|uniref:uncharacterized protein isoform X2 n=1 Tax=Primulina huaijiensis TaxID=1492673 RepID=UPI003CC73FDF
MYRNAFERLCYLLTHVGGLVESRHVMVEEKVAMFLSILAHHKKNRIISHDYIRSGHTVSTHFHEVLKSILKLYPILIAKHVPVDESCTNETWKWFKGCVGALDGTYISVHVSNQQKPKYRIRKGTTTVNILGVCDREMRFIYALTGWEGSAADARVLRDAIHRQNGLKVPREMEFRTSSSKGHDKGKKIEKTRRVWTTREEDVLLQALKEAVNHGWKSENGFRIGYLGFLEYAMKKTFPNTDLRANPHINSKIHVWKKFHGTLMTLLSKSGIGWNGIEKMIDATNEAWELLEKMDSSVHGMRYRSWPYYNDWCEIFGRDRSTGERSESFADAVQEDDLNLGNTDGAAVGVGLEKLLDGFEDNADSISISDPIFSDATSGKKSVGKKRKRSAEIEDRIFDAMNKFSDMTQVSIDEL